MNEFNRGYERMLRRLNLGEELEYGDIAEIAGCTKRHARRLIVRAEEEGVPVARGKRGRRRFFSIPEHLRTHAVEVALSDDELLALTVAGLAVQSSLGNTPLGAALDNALAHLRSEMRTDELYTDYDDVNAQYRFNTMPAANIDPEIFRTVRHAIDECSTIEIDYISMNSGNRRTRLIDPHTFEVVDGSWMVVAWCRTAQDVRTFSLPDIEAATLTEEYFTRREEIDENRRGGLRFGGVGGDDVFDISLIVDAECARAFHRKLYHSSQKIEEIENGRLRVRFRVAGLNDIRSFVQSWGDRIVVEEPQELRALVEQEAVNVVARYTGKERS